MGGALNLVRAIAPVCTIALAVAFAPLAAADEASPAQIRDLASRAYSDPSALDALRRIDTVGGRPVDLDAALRDASGPLLAERLRVLAAPGDAAPVDAAASRSTARRILRETRFTGARLPRPFRGPLQRLGAALQGLVDRIARHVPGREATVWIVLGAAAVAIAVFVTLRAVRRRVGGATAGARREREPHESAAAIERRAAEAERAGNYALAVRLRFAAGLLRLDEAGVIEYRSSLRSGEVARRLRTRSFRTVADAFDGIVYGGRAAGPDDAVHAREGWARVLEEAAR